MADRRWKCFALPDPSSSSCGHFPSSPHYCLEGPCIVTDPGHSPWLCPRPLCPPSMPSPSFGHFRLMHTSSSRRASACWMLRPHSSLMTSWEVPSPSPSQGKRWCRYPWGLGGGGGGRAGGRTSAWTLLISARWGLSVCDAICLSQLGHQGGYRRPGSDADLLEDLGSQLYQDKVGREAIYKAQIHSTLANG